MKINVHTLKNGTNRLTEDISPLSIDVHDINFDKDMIHVALTLFFSNSQIECHGKMDFSLRLVCDRCLSEFSEEISIPIDLFFSQSIPVDAEDENAFHWDQRDSIIDLSTVLRDLVYLSIPQKTLCDPDCKGLCTGCGVNLNSEICTCKNEFIDERFAPLLLFKSKLAEE